MTKVVALKKEARSTKKASSKKVVKAVAKEKPTKIKLAGFPAELVLNGNELTYDDITNFVRTEAGGNENNVEVTALVDKPEDVPFGWGGKKGGVRDILQKAFLTGYNGDKRLGFILNQGAKLGHSRKKPNVLLALLNGGYSPSSKYWGTPYVKLTVTK
tara:strand:- start:226 stop:699 length:474 start_codon:yes stop_codon:yes gene_type:complete